MMKQKAKNDDICVPLTQGQASFLLALLEGFVARESYRLSARIIRQANQVGARVAKASGKRWRQ